MMSTSRKYVLRAAEIELPCRHIFIQLIHGPGSLSVVQRQGNTSSCSPADRVVASNCLIVAVNTHTYVAHK